MAFEQWLQLGQAFSVLLLWLFYIGRWVGKHDGRIKAPPKSEILPICHNIFEEIEVDLKHRLKEENRTRDRLHSLEHFQSNSEARLSYLEREVERLRGPAIQH